MKRKIPSGVGSAAHPKVGRARRTLTLVFVAIVCVARSQPSVAGEDLLNKVFHAMHYAELMRAVVAARCVGMDPYSTAPGEIRLCEKVHRIPDRIIEDAARPFFHRYITEQDARDEIVYRSSDPGKKIASKRLTEISTGRTHLLNEREIMIERMHNQTKAGKAFMALAADRTLGYELAKAMAQFEP